VIAEQQGQIKKLMFAYDEKEGKKGKEKKDVFDLDDMDGIETNT
jgi:hypothetical protein